MSNSGWAADAVGCGGAGLPASRAGDAGRCPLFWAGSCAGNPPARGSRLLARAGDLAGERRTARQSRPRGCGCGVQPRW